MFPKGKAVVIMFKINIGTVCDIKIIAMNGSNVALRFPSLGICNHKGKESCVYVINCCTKSGTGLLDAPYSKCRSIYRFNA